jgi:hypothetical protein
MRRFIIIALCLVFVFSFSGIAFAQENGPGYSEVPTIGDISPYENFAVGELQQINSLSATAGSITNASNQLTNLGGGAVACSSNTRTNGRVDQISVDYQIQKWNGSSWVFFTSGSTTGYNTSNYSGAISRQVELGFYYRLVTYHYSYIGGALVGSQSVTSTSIYIG